MRTYLVTWEIEIEASSHWNAARKAKEIMDDPDSLATVFDVREVSTEEVTTEYRIDLLGLRGEKKVK